jgi:hypothetical protein
LGGAPIGPAWPLGASVDTPQRLMGAFANGPCAQRPIDIARRSGRLELKDVLVGVAMGAAPRGAAPPGAASRRAHVVVLQLSRLLRSFVGLGGRDESRSLPGQDRCRSGRGDDGGCGGAGLNGAVWCRDLLLGSGLTVFGVRTRSGRSPKGEGEIAPGAPRRMGRSTRQEHVGERQAQVPEVHGQAERGAIR